MPTVLQFRRGTTAQNDSFTGAAGEVSIDTQKSALRIHDGSTAGGVEVASASGTASLTNKTIDTENNTITFDLSEGSLSGTLAEFNTALSDGTFTEIAATQTLSNKTIDSGNNTLTVDLSEATVTGTLSEFNTALSDGSFASLAGSETLTNKTLTSPVLNTATVGTSIVPSSADGATLGSATAEFSDLFLADGAIINFGNDQDVTLTHIADTALRLNLDLQVEGGNIGTSTDPDLLGLADNALTVNGTITATATATLLLVDSSGSTLKTINGFDTP